MARKNEHFRDALLSVEDFSTVRAQLVTKMLYQDDDFFLFKVAVNRSIHRETKEFTVEDLDNWPSVLMAVWNDPAVQIIAIQKRSAAFAKSEILVKAVLLHVEAWLDAIQLRVHYEPLFELKKFWDIIRRHEGRVQSLAFHFVTPNMANISGSLPEDLKNFGKETNSATNTLQITSDSESALKIESENETLQGLVNYSAEGGGNISIKVAGLKKKYNTSTTVKEIELSEVDISGPAEEVVAVLKDLLKQ